MDIYFWQMSINFHLRLHQLRQVISSFHHVWVARSKRLLADGKQALKERLDLVGIALVVSKENERSGCG